MLIHLWYYLQMNGQRHKRAFDNLLRVPSALVIPSMFLGSGIAKVTMGKELGWLFIGVSLVFVLIFYFASYFIMKSREHQY